MINLASGICPPRQVISNRFFASLAIALAGLLSHVVVVSSGFGIICFQTSKRMRVRLRLLFTRCFRGRAAGGANLQCVEFSDFFLSFNKFSNLNQKL